MIKSNNNKRRLTLDEIANSSHIFRCFLIIIILEYFRLSKPDEHTVTEHGHA